MKRLYRSTRDRKIAGVCGGLAEYFGIDPRLIRVLWLIWAVLAGFGIVVYIICWIVLPEDRELFTEDDPVNTNFKR